MTTVYSKDVDTGVVALNCQGVVSLTAPKRPAEDTPEVAEWVSKRNHSGRVYIPGDAVPYQVAVITKDATYVVSSGITNAPTSKTVTPIFVRVRQEEPTIEPQAPVVAEEIR